MKHKQFQPSIILFLVAIAFFIKGIIRSESIMLIIGVFILILSLSRAILILKLSDIDLNDENYDDFIVTYLKQNEIEYVEMLDIYRKGEAEALYAESDGILLYDEANDTYHGTADTIEAAKDIIYKLPQDYRSFIAYHPLLEEVMEKELAYSEKIYYYNYIYPCVEKLPLANKNIEIRMLDDTYLKTIKEHYSVKSLANDSYLKGRIEAGMLGAFINNELVGYIGRHPSGPIGMIEVFENFRGHKIGATLQAEYINRLLEESDDVIFTQVNENNKISDHMQKNLGFIKADQKCCWYIE